MFVEPATLPDLADCQSIYAHHVLAGTGTFEEIPPSVEEMTARFEKIRAGGWPWLVAKDGVACLGFGYCGQYRDRSAYRFAAEDAVYVREGARGQGVGRLLLAELLRAAATAGATQMLAVIGDSANAGSIRLHQRLGFTHAGILRAVGYKFNRWLDVVIMQTSLSQPGD